MLAATQEIIKVQTDTCDKYIPGTEKISKIFFTVSPTDYGGVEEVGRCDELVFY